MATIGNLHGRVALITGASRGIGRAVAVALGRAGAAVAVGCLSGGAAAAVTAGAIRAAGARAEVFRADVADPAAAAGLVAAVVNTFGGLHILVNNAGVGLSKLLMDTQPAEWNRLMAVHLGGAYNCTRAAMPHLLAAGGAGRIINISSIWGQIGAANEVAYSAAKAGLIGFTRALAKELGKAGITVNAIAPGAVLTDMLGEFDAEELAFLVEQIPGGRLGRPDDVAAAAVYLCSAAAGYITGQVIGVSGGLVM